jgi:hypothetical protein
VLFTTMRRYEHFFVVASVYKRLSAIGVYAGEVTTGGEVICLIYHVCVEPGSEPTGRFVPRLEFLSGAAPLA